MARHYLFYAHLYKICPSNGYLLLISRTRVQSMPVQLLEFTYLARKYAKNCRIQAWRTRQSRPPPWSYAKVVQNRCFGARSGINFSAAGNLENPYRRSSSSMLPECSRLVSRFSSGDPIATSPLELSKSSPKSMLWSTFWHQFLHGRKSRKSIPALYLANAPGMFSARLGV